MVKVTIKIRIINGKKYLLLDDLIKILKKSEYKCESINGKFAFKNLSQSLLNGGEIDDDD